MALQQQQRRRAFAQPCLLDLPDKPLAMTLMMAARDMRASELASVCKRFYTVLDSCATSLKLDHQPSESQLRRMRTSAVRHVDMGSGHLEGTWTALSHLTNLQSICVKDPMIHLAGVAGHVNVRIGEVDSCYWRFLLHDVLDRRTTGTLEFRDLHELNEQQQTELEGRLNAGTRVPAVKLLRVGHAIPAFAKRMTSITGLHLTSSLALAALPELTHLEKLHFGEDIAVVR